MGPGGGGMTWWQVTDAGTGALVPLGTIFVIHVLPTIVFFSSLMAILYHLGIMQQIIRSMAWVMRRTMGTSGAESLSVAANIFVGQTEAPAGDPALHRHADQFRADGLHDRRLRHHRRRRAGRLRALRRRRRAPDRGERHGGAGVAPDREGRLPADGEGSDRRRRAPGHPEGARQPARRRGRRARRSA